jgi:subtilisin-like proprotein convertase family protein
VVTPAARDTLLSDPAAAAIPDGGTEGLVRLLEIDPAAAGPVLGVAVGIDVTHPFPEQLEIVLHAPDGTAVTLHDHAGDGSPDLVGTWPTTLTVTGPGSLDDLVGSEAAGTWALWIGDATPGGVGTLNAWSLQLTLTPRPSAADDAGAPRLVRAVTGAPNPFNPRTTLRFELTSPARTRLSVYDVRGMLVRRLLDRNLGAGPHAVVWDGRDEGGRAAASGVYLVRLRAGAEIHESKLTLVR